MSRAFVKEFDGAEALELPDRPISRHPNFVTAGSLAQMDATLGDAIVAGSGEAEIVAIS